MRKHRQGKDLFRSENLKVWMALLPRNDLGSFLPLDNDMKLPEVKQ